MEDYEKKIQEMLKEMSAADIYRVYRLARILYMDSKSLSDNTPSFLISFRL